MHPFLVSAFMMLAFIVSIIASSISLYATSEYFLINHTQKRTKSDISNVNIENRAGRKLHHAYFYFAILLGLGLLLLGDSAIGHLDKAHALPGGVLQSAEYPELYFGKATAKDAECWLWYLMLVSIIISFIVGIFHLFAAYSSHQLDKDLDSKLGKAEGMCLAQVIFGGITMCLSCAARSALEGRDLGICDCALKSIWIIGLISVLLAFANFGALYFEHKLGIKILSILSGVVAALAIILGGFVMYEAMMMPVNEYECQENLLSTLHRDYLSQTGCPAKYKTTSKYITELVCPKKDIQYVWEDALLRTVAFEELDVYGCLNRGCCPIALSDYKIIFWTAAASSIILGLALVLTSVASFKFQTESKELGRSYLSFDDLVKGGHLAVLIVMILGYLLLFAVAAKLRSHVPVLHDLMKADNMPKGVPNIEHLGKIESIMEAGSDSNSYQLVNYTVHLDKKQCEPFCEDFVYHVRAECPEGSELFMDPAAYKNKEVIIFKDEEPKNRAIKFKTWYKHLNDMLKLIKIKPGDFAGKINVTLDINVRQEPDFDDEIKQFYENKRLRLLDNDFYQGENPFTPVLKKTIGFQIFNSDVKTVYTGRVMHKDIISHQDSPLDQVAIEARCPQLGDKVLYQGINQESGKFEFPLTMMLIQESATRMKSVPYNVNVKLSKPGYASVILPITVGVNAMTTSFDLGTIILADEYTSKEPVNVTGTVFDTKSNKGISDVKVSIHNGALLKETTTNIFGGFNINSVEFCGNSIDAIKKGYYPYKSPSHCETNDTQVDLTIPLTQLIEGYKLRTVLTWKGANEDLDLHVTFIKSESMQCKVSYNMPMCGGAKLHKDVTKKNSTLKAASEIIDLDTIGPYQYIFYVEDFNYNKLSPLFRSKSHIDVFAGTIPDAPLTSFDVPKYDKPINQNVFFNV